MKIKFEVDLSDYYDEEEGLSIDENIRDGITHEVTQKVRQDFRKTALDEFANLIREQFKLSKEEYFKELIISTFENDKVKKQYGGGNEFVTIKEYVHDAINQIHFNDSEVTRQFNILVEQNTDSIASELKERYDMLFASQLVSKMNQNGMLKDDVAKLLLPEKGENEG